MIYIVTRDRLGFLKSTLPVWFKYVPAVTLVTEMSEHEMHEQFAAEHFKDHNISVVSFDNNRGMGFQRAQTFNHAYESGHQHIIMTDDDQFPVNDPAPMLDFIRENSDKALGIGAMKRTYKMFLGDEAMSIKSPMLITGSIAKQTAAWSVENVLRVGNFNIELDCSFEDSDMCLRGIQDLKPWHAHGAVYCDQVAKRFSPGGIMTLAGTLEERDLRIEQCAKIARANHPRYTNKDGGPLRFYWRKCLTDYYGKKWQQHLNRGIMV